MTQMKKQYFNVHNHTDLSNIRMLDSINRTSDLIDKSIELGLSGIAITDHECLTAHMTALNHMEKIREENPDFKLALGNEIYLISERGSGKKYFHFILVAKDEIGYKGLRELSSTAWSNTYKDRIRRVPTLKSELEDIMKEYSGHIIATTACLGGQLSSLAMALNKAREIEANHLVPRIQQEITDFVNWCKDVFKDDFYIECAPSSKNPQMAVNKKLVDIAKHFGVKVVPGTDSHYLTAEDRPMHKGFLTAEAKEKSKEREVDDFYEFARCMDYEECYQLLTLSLGSDDATWVMENSLEIQDKIAQYSLKNAQKIPEIHTLKDYPRVENLYTDYPIISKLFASDNIQERFWVNTCVNKMKELNLENEEYCSRLEEEADIVNYIGEKLECCLFSYFNTFNHYIELFWECGSIVGPGRGSATGFLSNYFLGITQLDPIRWGLPHWRFLNRERAELPDIDIDLAPSKKGRILKEMRKTRGYYGLSQVLTIGQVKTRKAIQTACRGYRSASHPDGIDVEISEYMSSLVPSHRGFPWSLRDMVYGNMEEDRRPVTAFLSEVNRYEGLLDLMMSIQGLSSSASSHAAGVVLYEDDPYEVTSFMRTPRGDLVTCFDLHDSEDAGSIKYDFLVTSVTDKMVKTLELLQTDNVIDSTMTLKETYDTILHPEVMNSENPLIWEHLTSCDILDVFQFNEGSGLAIAKKLKPQNPLEATAANAMMRLMSEKGKESQQDRYVRIKSEGLEVFDKELKANGFDEKERELWHKHCDVYYGCCPLQEQMMMLLMDIAGFTLAEANDARKIVGKKLMEKIPDLEKQVFEKFDTNRKAMAFWELAVRPQLGYAFSINHSLPYSFVGMQTIELSTRFHPTYWNTACLIVDGGMPDDDDESDKTKSTDYGKIAKAINHIQETTDIKLSTIDINKSLYEFVPDPENNRILYGLKAVSDISDTTVENIVKHRPYSNFNDFCKKVNPSKAVIISLIKGGAFDEMHDRKMLMGYYLWKTCDKKQTLNLRNMAMLIKRNRLPESLSHQVSVFECTRFIKAKCIVEGDYYVLSSRPANFVMSNYPELKTEDRQDGTLIRKKDWETIYQQEMDSVRSWIQDNLNTLLDDLNKEVFLEEWNKRASGSLSTWEMSALCFYHHEHELSGVNFDKYNIVDFNSLPATPEVNPKISFTNAKGDYVRLFYLSHIAGTCIAKNATKGIVTILTTTGVVTVKFPLSYFSIFNKRISDLCEDGKRHIVEQSWFNRGTMIVVQGVRKDDSFIPKTYKKIGGHHLYKITEICGEEIKITHERYKTKTSTEEEEEEDN